MKQQIFSLIAAFFVLCSCSAKAPPEQPAQDLFVLLANPEDGHVGKIIVTNQYSTSYLNTAGAAIQVNQQGLPVPAKLSEEDIQAVFGEALAALPQAAESHQLFFIPAQTVLQEESQRRLPELLQKIKNRGPKEVIVVGHSDTLGEADYNLMVSQQRAQWMRDELAALGIPKKHIQVEARGDTDLLIPTPDNVPEPRNRRVEIILR